MQLKLGFLIYAAVQSIQGLAAETSIEFRDHGVLKRQVTINELSNLVGIATLKVFEPHEQKEVIYEGFDTNKVLELIYGKAWQSQDELLLQCSDGYRPSLPVTQFKSSKSLLAIRRLDQKDLKLTNKLQNNEVIDLGPLYLVWNNIAEPDLREHGASGWPYQLVAFDFVTFKEVFPHLAPPKSSSSLVTKGFLNFRTHCLACHTINGEGGGKAPELNYPVSVTEYIDKAWLKRWILEPTSIRLNTPMPGFKSLANANAMVESVIAYLQAMKSNKKLKPAPK